MPVYIVQHGEKETDKKKYPVDSETPLTAEGFQHSVESGKALRKHIDSRPHSGECIVIASPYERTKLTANAIAPALDGLKVIYRQDSRIVGINSGEFYPYTPSERLAKWPKEAGEYYRLKSRGHQARIKARAVGGEDMQDVFKRLGDFCTDLRKNQSPEDIIIIVSHKFPGRAICNNLLRKPEMNIFSDPSPDFSSIRFLEGKHWRTLRDRGVVHRGSTDEMTSTTMTHTERATSASVRAGKAR
jgi:broad specificity phosphatase PhoE